MRIKIEVKKVGDHWYPCLIHVDPNDLSLDIKMERLLNKIDSNFEFEKVTVIFTELHDIVDSTKVVTFEEQDILRYLTTNDSFFLNMYVGEHHFYISSELYTLLEDQFNFNFHKTLYKIEVW